MEEAQATQDKRTWVDDEVFISAWEQGSSEAEVADALGLKLASVQQRARNLRTKGVNLKEYPKRNGKKGDAYYARLEQMRLGLNTQGGDDASV